MVPISKNRIPICVGSIQFLSFLVDQSHMLIFRTFVHLLLSCFTKDDPADAWELSRVEIAKGYLEIYNFRCETYPCISYGINDDTWNREIFGIIWNIIYMDDYEC